MLVVYTSRLEAFRSPCQIHFGAVGPSPEVPERTRRIVDALQETGLGRIIDPGTIGPDLIEQVHSRGYLDYLREANRLPLNDPESKFQPTEVLFPAVWPYSTLWKAHSPTVMSMAGTYCYDTYTPIISSALPSALLAASCALTAADRVWQGEAVAMAVCRPPGHHAMRSKCGGFCYLNNAAIATRFLAAGGRVAILDIDYHHGNGTQEIFYDSEQVMVVSLHADPAEAYPYFSGYADERGVGKGFGFNLNIPLPGGTEDARYGDALELALGVIRQFTPRFLIVSLGFDICATDPLTTFRIQPDYLAVIASKISGLELPTVIVTEGGYDLDHVGQLAVHFVRGWHFRKA